MRHKQILAVLGAGLLLAACSSPARLGGESRTNAQPGTITYRVGEELSPGITVIDHIPLEKLRTSGSVALDRDPCRSVPPTVVQPAGFPGKPVRASARGCDWVSSVPGLWLRVGAVPPQAMARAVTEHTDMASGRAVADPLAHLAWLLVDGHYVIERILKNDPASSCFLTLDLGSPSVAFVIVHAIDLARKGPATAGPEQSKATFCPAARTVTQNFLRHLFDPLGPPSAGISTR